MMDGVWTVAKRELEDKIQDRGFLIFTAFMLFLVAAGAVGGVLFAEPRAKEYSVGVAGGESTALRESVSEQAQRFSAEVSFEPKGGVEEAERAVREGHLDAAVVGADLGSGRLLVEGEPDTNLAALLQSSAQIASAEEALRTEGIDPVSAGGAAEATPLPVTDVGAEDDGSGPGAAVAVVGAGLLFFTVFLYGAWIANSVVEEKSSRVVEVVLSAVRPSQLLAGKILGVGLLGLGQLTLIVGLGSVAALAAGLELPPPVFGAVATTLFWFVLGFVFYSCLFAIAGSVVSRQEDLQYTQLPIMGFVFGCYGISFAQLGDPGSLLAQALSFFPPLTPMLMPLRAGFGEVAPLEIFVAAALMVATTTALVVAAGRLYSGSILRFGARVKLRDAWRSAR